MNQATEQTDTSTSNQIFHPYECNPTQKLFHGSSIEDKGFKGAKGSGKTAALVNEAWLLAYENPGIRGIIGRKDLKDLKESTKVFFFNYCPPQIIIQQNEVDQFVILRTVDPNKTSRIKFAHGKDPKSFESDEIGFFALDEADEFEEETVKTLITRRRQKGVARFGLYAFNPPATTHWLHKFFVKDLKENPDLAKHRILFSNTTFENQHNLPAGYIDQLKRTYAGDQLKRFLYGEWGSVSSELAVFPSFREQVYVSTAKLKHNPGVTILRAIDYGMNSGCLWAELHGKQLRVLKEMVTFNRGADTLNPHIVNESLEYEPAKYINLSDPTFINNRVQTDARTVKQISREHGIELMDGVADWALRTSAVQWFMDQSVSGEPCLLIDPSCETLIAGFNGEYRYSDKAIQRRAADVEDSVHTAVHDCLQHICWKARTLLMRNQTKSINIPQESYDFNGYAD